MKDYGNNLELSRTFQVKDGQLSLYDSQQNSQEKGRAVSTATSTVNAPGAVIDDKYEILAQIGEGGMGSVYRVRHIQLDKEMALKTFRTATLSADAWQRFQREAQSIGKLDHPNIIQVFDFGISDQNFPFYTMELLIGESLSDRLKRSGRLSVEEALRIFGAVAAGLAHAHRLGIVHRDIKPANIFLEEGKDNPKLVDFGLAKLATEQSMGEQKLTATGLIFGSPLYMSPEQALGLDTDQRTDLYSFGCALFEALTGRPPFVGSTALVTIGMHSQATPPTLRQASGGQNFPGRLEALVARLLSKRPQDRYQLFEEVSEDFASIQSRLPSTVQIGQDSGRKNKQQDADRAGERSAELDARATSQPPGASRLLLMCGAAALAVTVISLSAISLIGGFRALSKRTGPSPATGGAASAPVTTHSGPGAATTGGAGATVGKSEPNVDSIIYDPDQSADWIKYANSPPHYYQGPGAEGTRDFKFWPTKSIGTFSFGAGERREARGVVNIPAIARFKAGLPMSQFPTLFRGFSKDDLTDLGLPIDLIWDERHFREIARLKSLKALHASAISKSAKIVDCLNDLPNLTILSVSSCEINGEALAQIKNLTRLQYLEANYVKDISPLLDELVKSDRMAFLSLIGCGLSKDDLNKLARVKGLSVLFIDNNTALSIKDLECLGALSSLHNLGIAGLSHPTRDLSVFKSLPSLFELRIDKKSWREGDLARLRQVLPKKCVIADISR